MESTNPRFNSKSLQEVYDSNSVHIDGYLLNLDAVSEDIKALEAYLGKAGIRHKVAVECDRDQTTAKSVSWEEDPKSKQWRIMQLVTTYTFNGPADTMDEPDSWDAEEQEPWPLIECKAHDRLVAYPALTKLLQQVAESVRLEERLRIPKP